MKKFSLGFRGLFHFAVGVANLCALTAGAVTFSVSPSTVSNTYSGYIILQVTGLSTGDTVLVQKYLDANTNGVVDAADLLTQQFQLTDNQASVIGGVTNINVPGDTDSTAGTIVAKLNFQNGIAQNFIGKYLVRLSSPAGHFTPPLTNNFAITNAGYNQSFSGSVVNSGTNVPNAFVLLFQPSGDGGLNPQVGTVANNSGAYSIKAAPGAYTLLAVKSNFVASLLTAPQLTLTNGANIVTNLTLTNATQNLSGKIVDAANASLGLPGLLVPASSTTNGWLTVAFTDTNGNFTLRVRPDLWKIQKNETDVGTYGYLVTQNSARADTSTGSVSGITLSYPKATALFYGSIKDNLNRPMTNVDLFAQDENGQYETEARTHTNGNYVIGALCGATWRVEISNDGNAAFTNYVFSQSPLNQSGGTNLTCGQVAQVNFTALIATNHITGWVRDLGGNPLANVQVYAFANINGLDYQSQTYTDGSGNYSLKAANGDWYVNICCGCDDCGDGCLPTTYQCPGSEFVTIANNNGTAYFTAYQLNQPVLSQPEILASGQIGFYLSGAVGSNYTIRVSTNLALPTSSWSSFLVTNLPTSPVFIEDTHATNKQLFYRAVLGP